VFDKRYRPGVERGLVPAGDALRRTGVSADQLTALGVGISVAAAVAVARGALGVAALLLALSAVVDVLDGAVAKAAGTASARGAFFDSVADRVSDSLVLGGLAWYLAGAESPHVALLPVAVMAGSNLVSYERARAESLGFTARGGLMERAERMLGVFLGLVVSSLLVPILWVMLALIALTASQRFAMVWRQASAPPPAPAPTRRRLERRTRRGPGPERRVRVRVRRPSSAPWRRPTAPTAAGGWRRERVRRARP